MSTDTESLRQILGTREWLASRLVGLLRHLHRCPECGVRPDPHWRSMAPRWDEDRVAAMLGVGHKGCRRCGNGAVRP